MISQAGSYHDPWVRFAFGYVPPEVRRSLANKVVIASTGDTDGKTLPASRTQGRAVILLSERMLPDKSASDGTPEGRYFVFIVLHELAHVHLKHPHPAESTPGRVAADEQKADAKALEWFNRHVRKVGVPEEPEMTIEEVLKAKEVSASKIKAYYEI